jgi:hypothetical protein
LIENPRLRGRLSQGKPETRPLACPRSSALPGGRALAFLFSHKNHGARLPGFTNAADNFFSKLPETGQYTLENTLEPGGRLIVSTQ